MELLPRSARSTVEAALETFRVVSISGPRQSGKTTPAGLIGRKRDHTFVPLDVLLG